MANALGTLFKDIANAIRGKTGNTATMKPADFPSAIAGIVTGGAMTGTWISKHGSFTATSEIQTVTHNLGVVPDIVIITAAHAPGARNLIASYGLSQRILDSGTITVPPTVYLGNEFGTIVTHTPNYSVDSTGEMDSDGFYKNAVREATAISFKAGGEHITLSVGESYYYSCLALT